MDKKLLDYLFKHFCKDNLLDLLDESSRRYKISRYNNNWKYFRPKDATAYEGGIRWDPYDLDDSLSFSKREGYITPEQYDELRSLVNKENGTVIPYSELPNYYKDSYEDAFELSQGPRDDETLEFLRYYGSDDDNLVDFNSAHDYDLDDLVKYNYKFGNAQLDPTTGEALYARGTPITKEALDKIRSKGIEKFLSSSPYRNSTDIVGKKRAKDVLDKLRDEAYSTGRSVDDVWSEYFTSDDGKWDLDLAKKYGGSVGHNISHDYSPWDYLEEKEKRRNIADALSGIKY